MTTKYPTRRSTRRTKIITWPDGTVSSRYVSRNAYGKITSIAYRLDKKGRCHRPDGNPAYIEVRPTGEPVMVMWCDMSENSIVRLSANLPNLWDGISTGIFVWNNEKNHNTSGPAWINGKGEQGFYIDSKELTLEEFKERYLITHLKEYVDIDAKKLYKKLYLEMMAIVQEELVMT